jgi:hypothetical protein
MTCNECEHILEKYAGARDRLILERNFFFAERERLHVGWLLNWISWATLILLGFCAW